MLQLLLDFLHLLVSTHSNFNKLFSRIIFSINMKLILFRVAFLVKFYFYRRTVLDKNCRETGFSNENGISEICT